MDSSMKPRFNNKVFSSPSGYEVRTSLQDQPLWDFELSYDYLPNRRDGMVDLETIQAFFLNRRGSYESFLYRHPETPFEVATPLGTGNGTNKDFLLVKSTGSFTEFAGGIHDEDDIMLFLDGLPVNLGSYTLVDHRTVRFNVAPPAGVDITADYQPLYRVRFKDDMVSFDGFMHRLWELNQVELKGVFL